MSKVEHVKKEMAAHDQSVLNEMVEVVNPCSLLRKMAVALAELQTKRDSLFNHGSPIGKVTAYGILAVGLLSFSALAYENTTLNITAAGSISTVGSYTNTGSIVPVGGQTSTVGSLYHQSGFASGFILQPSTALGVLPDELNPDNDSDGMDDSSELIAGTSANNLSSIFWVSITLLPNGQKIISWFGVQGRNYTFQYCDSLNSDNWQSYPFEISGSDTTISFTDSSTTSNRFYRVKVRLVD